MSNSASNSSKGWTIPGGIFFAFFTLWSFFNFMDGVTGQPDLWKHTKVLIGVAGQISGLLMILIGKVCNCMGYLERLADEVMRRDAMRATVLSEQRDQPPPLP